MLLAVARTLSMNERQGSETAGGPVSVHKWALGDRQQRDCQARSCPEGRGHVARTV